jgi:hypothetical protein
LILDGYASHARRYTPSQERQKYYSGGTPRTSTSAEA